ncbi:hypothetical protein MAR_020382 [Mya arenaria]|uniref:B box-type domain-containing protein n=1 Tax=Mya arenaria TaxID=6604 RepID=A0ABY7E4S8_MYAAR|nr:E3 ubiquitin-protein ligase TRIM33-like [Mya arenaria]WAR05013.1 hypothetical protein MAR_020382 [Mya arenaria]
MATGAAYKGSDLVSDYNCSKCEIFDLNVEAQHFCSECEHYLCDNCVKSHNEYHRKHTVYKREDIPKWAGVTIDRCDQHGKKLEYNCNVHQELCCYRCREHNHGRCSSFSRLPDLAKDFLKTEEYKQLPAAVDKLRCSLDELKNDRMNNEALLNDTYKKTLAEVKTLRKKNKQHFGPAGEDDS